MGPVRLKDVDEAQDEDGQLAKEFADKREIVHLPRAIPKMSSSIDRWLTELAA